MTIPLAAASASTVVDGTLGFVVVAGMAVAMVLLFRSMTKHLRKVNDAAPGQQQPAGPETGQPGGPSSSP